MKLEIRLEEKKDYRKVEEMIREAFWNLYVPGASEHFIPHYLRNSKITIPELNFVALKDGEIVGQIFYTKAEVRDKNGNNEYKNFFRKYYTAMTRAKKLLVILDNSENFQIKNFLV